MVHLPNTLADSIRVSQDLGILRYSARYFHTPVFLFKGSFIACKHEVERIVTFDHGIEGSITEDSYFAVKAANQGYTFDWIEGEMQEKSPFSIADFFRQRKRWHQGFYFIATSKNLKWDFTCFMFKYEFYF